VEHQWLVPRTAKARELVIALGCAPDVAVAGESARAWAKGLGIHPSIAAELATCAAELASNIVRHGGGGTLVVGGDADRVCMSTHDRGTGDVVRMRALLDAARAQARGMLRSHDEHGLATLVRWMDAIDVEGRPGGGLSIRASRARTGARGLGA
jgi:anti-sigma regulatory factor (Ser/Thr protein kinase)